MHRNLAGAALTAAMVGMIALCAAIPVSAQDVFVYDDANFQGRAQGLSPGRYNWGQLSNDSISSVLLPFGMKVILFRDTFFQGPRLELTSLSTYVGDAFNDETSSIIVLMLPTEPAVRILALQTQSADPQQRVTSFIALATFRYPEFFVNATPSGGLITAIFTPKSGGPPLIFSL